MARPAIANLPKPASPDPVGRHRLSARAEELYVLFMDAMTANEVTVKDVCAGAGATVYDLATIFHQVPSVGPVSVICFQFEKVVP